METQTPSLDLEAQRDAQKSGEPSPLSRHCPLCPKCLVRFANQKIAIHEEEMGAYEMPEVATSPSHANSDTSPPLLASITEDVNPERQPVVVQPAQAEGATSVFLDHPVPC
jgi:hypothetical protein